MKVDETCLLDTSQRLRVWLISLGHKVKSEVYKRIGLIKLRLKHEYVSILGQLLEESAKESEGTIV